VSWTATTAPINPWVSVVASTDGARILAGADYGNGLTGPIFASTNSGASWLQATAPGAGGSVLASSADGTTVVALAGPWIYISTNWAATWAPAGSPAGGAWQALAVSGDGSTMVALGNGVAAVLRPPTPPPLLPPSPLLSIGPSGVDLGLSWLAPSTPFVLQQSSDLGSTNWVDVPASPTLNFTNLHLEMTLTPPPGSTFYRLKQQRP
jgi:hypothetical protein